MRSQPAIILPILIATYNSLIHSTFSFTTNNNNLKLSFVEHRRNLKTKQPIQISSSITDSNNILDTSATNVEEDSATSLIGIKSLGVDFGTIRTGVAVTIGYAPIPLTVLNSVNTTELAINVVKLCQSEKATQIIIGLPLHKNGTISEQANITQKFAEIVVCTVYKLLGPTKVYLFDERYSSKLAMARILSSAPTKDRNKQYIIDADSACIILEHFYADNGVGKHLVTIPDHLQQECDDIWQQQDILNKQKQEEIIEERMNALNARRDMIKRVQMETSASNTTSKKKKKKKKRK